MKTRDVQAKPLDVQARLEFALTPIEYKLSPKWNPPPGEA
jgi:hypothetical protein